MKFKSKQDIKAEIKRASEQRNGEKSLKRRAVLRDYIIALKHKLSKFDNIGG